MSDDYGRRGRQTGRLWQLALAGLILLVFVGGWLVARAFTARPTAKTDYAAEINARVIDAIVAIDGKPPVPNQWDAITRIAADFDLAQGVILQEFPDAPEGWGSNTWPRDIFDVNPLTASEGTRARMHDIANLSAIREVLERTVILPQASGCRRLPTGAPLLGANLPELMPLRTLARAMASQMQLAVLDARWELAPVWYERTLALGRFMTTQPTLIDRLVGHAIVSMANERMLGSLAQTTPDDDALRAFEAALVRQLGLDDEGTLTRIPPLALAINNVRTSFKDSVQWCFTDDGTGDGRLIPTELQALSGVGGKRTTRFANLAGMFAAGRKQTIDVANRYFDAEIQLSKATVQQRRTMPDSTVELNTLPSTHLFTQMMLPAVPKARQSNDQLQLTVIATRIMLALERHRIRTSTYPQSLDQLVPTELASIPADPYTTLGLLYRGERSSYLLYSAGIDNQDNAGKQSEKEGERYAPLTREDAQGFDFLLGPPKKD